MSSNPMPHPMPQYFGKDLEAMSFAENYHDWIFSDFLPYIGDSVAEVGAGVGNFSRLLLRANIRRLQSFEPSQNMYPMLAKFLSSYSQAEAIHGFFGREQIGENLDSVLYVNVLEHIENDASELAVAYQTLKPNGYLLIFVPALPWLYSQFDQDIGHFRRYIKKDLIRLARQAGFSIVQAKYFDIAGVLPWYVNFVLLKNSISAGGVSLYDSCVVPIMRFVEGWIAPPIGKNILLVAQKKV